MNYNNIPNELKKENRWVLWNKTKIPINAKNGAYAKCNDPSTWSSYELCLEKATKLNCGMGFVLGGGYVGIDLDHLEQFDNNEILKDFIQLNSYTEISQSGSGIHIIVKGELPKGRNRKTNIEMYDNNRFFALTGNVFMGYDKLNTDNINDKLALLFKKYFGETETKYIYTSEEDKYVSTLSDSEIFDKINQSSNGRFFNDLYHGNWEGYYQSQSEADIALCGILAFWFNKDSQKIDNLFRQSGLYRSKWDEKRGSDTYGNLTIQQAIKNCVNTYQQKQEYSYYGSEEKKPVEEEYDLSDTGNAKRFIDNYGDNILYNYDNKCWMYYDGTTWQKDIKQLVKTKADIMIEKMKRECKFEEKEKIRNVKHLSSSNGKDAMLKEAMHLKPITNKDFDKDIYLLNCKNCIVDLKNGTFLHNDKKYLMSKNTNIDIPIIYSEPKKWIKFLHEVFNNDNELIEYIQKAMGYSLTGSTKEQCFFQCYGDGANGKSVFLDIFHKMLGDYAINSQVDTILAKNGYSGNANSEVARMSGTRFVRTNEPNEGSRFNEGLIKQLVSGDTTTARFLYGNEFEFQPMFKLWIATNYKIQVRGMDLGIWRRMRLIPFEVKFEGKAQNKNLINELMEELPQILRWAIIGCAKWFKEGFDKLPKKIEEANKTYKQEMDVLETFLKDNVLIREDGFEKSSELFKKYVSWAKLGNEYCMSQTKFGIEMSKKFQKKTINGSNYYVGIMLKEKSGSYIYGEQ